MHMAKIRTTITINKDLLEKAKVHNISISSFLDIELRRYIAFIEGNQWNHSQYDKKSVGTKDKENKSMDLSGFEPEASSMPRRRSSELIYKPM